MQDLSGLGLEPIDSKQPAELKLLIGFLGKQWDTVRELLASEGDLEIVRRDLFYICFRDNVPDLQKIPHDIVDLMIERTPSDELGMMLIMAANYSAVYIVQALLRKGVDVNSKDAHDGTALDFAYTVEIAKMLIGAGATIVWENTLRCTGRKPVIGYLLSLFSWTTIGKRVQTRQEYVPLLIRSLWLPLLLSPLHIWRIGKHSSLRNLNQDIIRRLVDFILLPV